MKPQEFIENILKYKSRNPNKGNPSIVSDFQSVVMPLYAFLNDASINNPLVKNFLASQINVYLIASLHVTFRNFMNGLVNTDFTYVKRLTKEYGLKFDIEYVGSLLENKVTLGDFISHHFQPNSLDEMAKLYKTLFQEDLFYKNLEAFFLETHAKTKSKITFSQLITSIKKVFEERHIACHELKRGGPGKLNRGISG